MVEGLIIDAMLRGIAAGAFAATGIGLAVSRPAQAGRWIGAAFFVAAIGHAIDNTSLLRGADGHAGDLFRIPSMLGPGLFWAFALSLFDDTRRLPAWRLAPAAAELGVGLFSMLAPQLCASWIWVAFNTGSILLICHAVYVIARGWKNDLVEPRRRLRAPVMGAAAAYVLVTAGGDLSATLGARWDVGPIAQAALLALLGVAGAVTLLRLDPSLLGSAAVAPSAAPRVAQAELDFADRATLARLTRAMDEEEIWRREDLSIGALADHVGAPEHRLRRLINGVLGHRNFAAFINARRIEAAKRALVDPNQARKPVSAIAYDLGFGSLGPFNRAFKDATGVTPTAWRQGEAAQGPSPIPQESLSI